MRRDTVRSIRTVETILCGLAFQFHIVDEPRAEECMFLDSQSYQYVNE